MQPISHGINLDPPQVSNHRPLGRPQRVGHLEPVVLGQLEPGDNRLAVLGGRGKPWSRRRKNHGKMVVLWNFIGKKYGFMEFKRIS